MGLFIYFLLILLFSWYAIFYLEFASLQLLAMAAFLPVILFVLLRILCRKIYIEISTKTVLAEKESFEKRARISLEIMVENTSKWLPLNKGVIYLEYENPFSGEKGSERLYFSVDCGSKEVRDFEIEVESVGNVSIIIRKIRIYDYLGMFWATLLKKREMSGTLVLPVTKEIFLKKESLISENSGEGGEYSPYKKGDDPSEIFGIREYKDGDKVQQIHWKLSMKKQTLMVKEYSLLLAETVVIMVDFSSSSTGEMHQKEMECLVQQIYSVSMALLEQELTQRFLWYDIEEESVVEETVTKEEELFWVFQKMFKNPAKKYTTPLSALYSPLDTIKPFDFALYLTANDGADVDAKAMGIRKLQVMNVK